VQAGRGRGHSSGLEQRANIKFRFKLGKTAAETVELIRQVYGDNCLSRAQICRWYARFKSGVETIEDEARPGRPFSVGNEGLTAKVRERIHCLMIKDTSVFSTQKTSLKLLVEIKLSSIRL
jgi:hypothetical protein